MADSDDEYIEDVSEDEPSAHQVSRRGAGQAYETRASGRQTGKSKATWEDIQRSWDNVVEGADGSINSVVTGLLEASKRSRLLRDTTPLQRGIIRHMIVVIDLSSAMLDKDLWPSRYRLSITYTKEFVTEYFEQNPISQLGLIGMRDGLAIRLSELSGNPSDHVSALDKLVRQDPAGNPSLQNALDMCRAVLYHTPSHGTREVLIIFGALLTSDPGDINQTITSLVQSKILVSVIGLAAKVAICTTLCSRTNSGSEASYSVALDEQHFRNLLLHATQPPITPSTASTTTSSLLMMGFPSHVVDPLPALCACHSIPSRGGYQCSRCGTRVCSLPAECPSCSLTLILSTHLARSYHHLFPLRNWRVVSWEQARAGPRTECVGCLTAFPPVPRDLAALRSARAKGRRGGDAVGGGKEMERRKKGRKAGGTSESSRYACEVCDAHFCIDCDVFAHELLHNCPSCQSRDPEELVGNGKSNGNGARRDGDAGEAMDLS